MADLEERVRERAYHLWLAAGSPEGRAEEFWAEAEQIEGGHVEPELPAAGPHARPDLVNQDATIGSGMMPDAEDEDGNQGPTG
jgi:hypothetical protein